MTDPALHFIKSSHGRRLVTEKHLAMLKGSSESKSVTYCFQSTSHLRAAWKDPGLQSFGACLLVTRLTLPITSLYLQNLRSILNPGAESNLFSGMDGVLEDTR